MEAAGILEVMGMTAAYVAGDAGCKAGNVRIEAMDKNKPVNPDKYRVPLLVSIKFRGSVEDVKVKKRLRFKGDRKPVRG